MAANILRQARRIPVECYPIIGTVAFSLSAGAYISTHTLRDTLDVSLHPHSNPHPWTKVSPDTPPPTSAFVPKSERMSAGHSSYTAGIFDSLKHAAAHRAAH